MPSTTLEESPDRALGAARAAAPSLDWSRLDVEQMFGFAGGRFTRPNTFFTALAGLLVAIAFYAALLPLQESYLAAMFLRRGPTPYAIVLLTCWSAAILAVKWFKIRLQRRALDQHIMPDDPAFVLSSTTVEPVLARVYAAVDDPRNFILHNRIVVALSNLRNLGRVTDVDEILRSQAEQDESMVENSYALVQAFVWAIPVLGFIGTVLGLSDAIGKFSGVLVDTTDPEQITAALKGVTAGLATAFETTLEALVAALAIQLAMTWLRKAENEFLDDAMEYGLRNVVARLRIMPEAALGVTVPVPSVPVLVPAPRPA
jgi:biopolymer transport protein ExbB/TolQ